MRSKTDSVTFTWYDDGSVTASVQGREGAFPNDRLKGGGTQHEMLGMFLADARMAVGLDGPDRQVGVAPCEPVRDVGPMGFQRKGQFTVLTLHEPGGLEGTSFRLTPAQLARLADLVSEARKEV